MYSRYKKKQPSKQNVVAVPRKSSVSLKKQLTSKLDKIFSLYIRLRDTDENGYFKCPTCGKIKTFKQADCSHYWSRKHTSTRWNEENCCAECSYDNRMNSSHLDGLGKYLKKKLGEQKFQMLEWQHNQPCKLGEFELAEMIKMYQKKVIELKKTKNFVVK